MILLPLDFVYISRRRALEMGFTHEGTLFGVPAWMMDVTDEAVTGCPKVPVLQAWTVLADLLCEFATLFLPDDQGFEAPLHVLRRIPLEETP